MGPGELDPLMELIKNRYWPAKKTKTMSRLHMDDGNSARSQARSVGDER